MCYNVFFVCKLFIFVEGVEGIQTVLHLNLVLCHTNGRNKSMAYLSQLAFESVWLFELVFEGWTCCSWQRSHVILNVRLSVSLLSLA